MTDFVVRRLLIDLETPFPRRCAGDAFQSAFLNALSMSFPSGEQYFIDSVRDAFKLLPADQQEQFRAGVQGFIGQEATHRRIHCLFNEHLYRQGLVNVWEPRVRKRIALMEGIDKRHALAITAAYEHFTAVFAEWVLRNHDLLDNGDPRIKTLWMWHSSEEAEHKNVVFDLYYALGGNHEWRVIWMRRIGLVFLSEALRQTLSNLWHDGAFWKWSTWTGAARYLFSKRGLLRENYSIWREYFRDDYHPAQQQSGLSQRWLESHAAEYAVVGNQ